MTPGTGDSASGSAVLFTQEPPPAFRTAANLVIIDVQVVAAQGKPVPSLTTAQFAVSIAGRTRKVVFAEFVHTDEGPINKTVRTTIGVAACVFGFERSATGTNSHYLLGVEQSDSVKCGKPPKIKVNHKDLTARRRVWRCRVAAPHAADREQ